MKKKLFIALLSLVCAVCCLVGLVACNGGNGSNNSNGEDKVKQNAEFVEFRKVITTILKDNGIFVNDFDNADSSKTKNAVKQSYTTATAADCKLDTGVSLLSANSKERGISGQDKQTIRDMLVQDKYHGDTESFQFTQKQMYGASLRMPLLIGDGAATYFNEKKFYDITVCLSSMGDAGTYIKVANADSTYNIQLYSPGSSNSDDTFDNIVIDFVSETNYSFYSVEWHSDNHFLYTYGNSQNEFIAIMYYPDDSYAGGVIYSPDGSDYYDTQELDIVNACYNLIRDEIPTDNSPYVALKSDVKYNLNNEQSNALWDKYFKDIQSTTDPEFNRDGIIYETIGGQQIASCYRATNGQTEVIIPSDVNIISSQFFVEDMEGNVTSLYIPKSVKKIIDLDGREITSMNEFRLGLMKPSGEGFFSNITVERDSPLFKSGSGHLISKNGLALYVVDKPLDSFDLDVLARASIQESNGAVYKNLYKLSGSVVTLYCADVDVVIEKYQPYGNVQLREQIQKVIDANALLETLNITMSVVPAQSGGDKPSGGRSYLQLNLNLKKDITINVVYEGCGENFSADLLITLENKTSGIRSVTVNVDGFTVGSYLSVQPLQPSYSYDKDKGEMPPEIEYVPNPLIYTTFNFNAPEMLFDEFFSGYVGRDKENSQIEFTGNYNKWNGWRFEDGALTLDNDLPNGSEVTVPDSYIGVSWSSQIIVYVDYFQDKAVKINLPKGYTVEFIAGSEFGSNIHNENFVIKYEGTIAEMDNMFSTMMDSGWEAEFTAECSDGTKLMRLGWRYSPNNPDNPDNWRYSATVNINGENKTFKFKGDEYSYTTLLQTTQNNNAYFLVNDADDTFIDLRFDYDSYDNDGDKELIAKFEKEHNGGHFTLYQRLAGNAVVYDDDLEDPNQRVVSETYNLSAENYGMTVTVAFVRDSRDHNVGGWAMISGITGAINDVEINFQGAHECDFYGSRLGREITLFTLDENEVWTSYYLTLSFAGNGLKVLRLKPTSLLENVEIRIGTEIVTRDFTRGEKYRFTDAQLPQGDYEYFYQRGNSGFNPLPKDDSGYYLEPWDEDIYYVFRLKSGQKDYNVAESNYDLTLSFDWEIPSESEIEQGQERRVRLVGISGKIDNSNVDGKFDVNQDNMYLEGDYLQNVFDSFTVNFYGGYVTCKFYVDGFDVKLQIEHVEFWGDKEK